MNGIWAVANMVEASYPGIPDWLQQLLNEGDLNIAMSDLRMDMDRAKRDSRAAVRVGDYYTKDNHNCGDCNRMAEGWYAFAHKSRNMEGSYKFYNLNGNPQILADALAHGYKNPKEIPHADFVICAKLFMDYLFSIQDISRVEVGVLQKFITTKAFEDLNDNDQAAFHDKLNLLVKKADPDKIFVTVVKSRIIESGDFKVGVYGSLQRPIELRGLPYLTYFKKYLDSEFPWFSAANELVYRQLVMQSQSSAPVFKLRPLLLAGHPGVGKTSWANRIAELSRVPFRTVMAAGGNDSMYLKGLARGWSSAKPGAVVSTISQEKIGNPIFLVDEIDKASPDSRNGRIWDVLLQMIEPATSKKFMDECLEVECDLSYVSWIATCNEIGNLPKPLLDRFTIVVVPSPGPEHFGTVVRGSVRKIAEEMKIDSRMLPSLDADDFYILEKCSSPREISRTVRLMLEKKMVQETTVLRRH